MHVIGQFLKHLNVPRLKETFSQLQLNMLLRQAVARNPPAAFSRGCSRFQSHRAAAWRSRLRSPSSPVSPALTTCISSRPFASSSQADAAIDQIQELYAHTADNPHAWPPPELILTLPGMQARRTRSGHYPAICHAPSDTLFLIHPYRVTVRTGRGGDREKDRLCRR